MDLSVSYLGLKISSPVVAGSCSITGSVQNLKKVEENGAGAVVLKSIFEEEIYMEYESILRAEGKAGNEALGRFLDYYDYKIKGDNTKKYLDLIRQAKEQISIPVVASINCACSQEWLYFAKKVQEAGADAIELNLFIMPSDFSKSSSDMEKKYLDMAGKIKESVSIPVAIKLSYYFSSLAAFIKSISDTGVDGVVLFNRFFKPDFDIDSFTVVPTNVLSTPAEISTTLQWVSILSDRVETDIIASTGVHSPEGVIKQLLVGAQAVQVASVLYKEGIGYIKKLNEGIEAWMKKHDFNNIDAFRGKMSQEKSDEPALYERGQFMKYHSDKTYDLD